MNFGLDDIINKSVLGTPEKDLEKFAEKFQLKLDGDKCDESILTHSN